MYNFTTRSWLIRWAYLLETPPYLTSLVFLWLRALIFTPVGKLLFPGYLLASVVVDPWQALLFVLTVVSIISAVALVAVGAVRLAEEFDNIPWYRRVIITDADSAPRPTSQG